ncbi:MAG TPA: hypothetical protein QGI71_06300 [Dehalococcoidia bacterium]|jgi:hypothetical protein|nr:hypothetical protein [Dehalococcoidia bacterium]
MATAEELRSEITTGFDSLREAIEGASSNWDSARLGIESTLRSELDLAVTVAETMEALRLPERQQFELADVASALSALENVSSTSIKVFGYVEDRDMVKTTPVMENIGGVMQAAADQAKGSAATIKAGS